MIQITPISPAQASEFKSILDPIIQRVHKAVQLPSLLDPTVPPIVAQTEKIIKAMGTEENPAQPITIIPGLLVQAFIPGPDVIISMLTLPKQSIQITAFQVKDIEPAQNEEKE